MFNKLDLNKICTSISQKYGFQYDLSSMLANLIYARILSPLSKLSSFEYIKELMEPPRICITGYLSYFGCLGERIRLHTVSHIYESTKNSRNDAILYYNCTNFIFAKMRQESESTVKAKSTTLTR